MSPESWNASLTTSLDFSPKHKSSVLSFTIFVSITNAIDTPSPSNTSSRYGTIFSLISWSSMLFIELIWLTTNSISPTSNRLRSWLKISFGSLELRSLPAPNISTANSSISTPQISDRSSAAFWSTGVQVGERNINVSEMIAAIKSPAIFFGISTPCSWYIW